MANVLQERNLVIVSSKKLSFFEWKFEKSDLGPGNVICSSNFNLGGADAWFLELRRDFFDTLYLYLCNSECVDIVIHYTIILSDCVDREIHSNVASIRSFGTLRKADLLSSFKSLSSSTNYPVTITCVIKVPNPVVSESADDISAGDFLLDSLKELSCDFKKILEDGNSTDISLDINGVVIRAHKIVLQARSPVFYNMFNHDTSEAAQNEVVIMDIAASTMKRLLAYLYSGRKEKCGFEETFELYYAADKYEVLSLRNICKNDLLDQLQVSNSCCLFSLANRHSDETFKEQVNFISSNFKSVVDTDAFEEMNKTDMKLLTRSCAHNILQ
ncbi:protein maternal effect lethal 26 [Parasteatoda tepidariorum]|uniref:protein maternal effect lethal 26 n=1 Tax=Parasteatoda tepidariorum TaxID=114398 RepID=UPI001C71A94A|nr:protein maternal effect lethal 26-like [Parasteatoda tepidariorum]